LSGDGEVLARETAAEEVNRGDFVPDGEHSAFATSCASQRSVIVPSLSRVRDGSHSCHVVVDGDSGPMGGKHGSPPRVGLAEERVTDSGSVEAEVESADT
jgi:hypothetical protein